MKLREVENKQDLLQLLNFRQLAELRYKLKATDSLILLQTFMNQIYWFFSLIVICIKKNKLCTGSCRLCL